MKEQLLTPIAKYSRGFKSKPLLMYFDTLEEYLAKYYKPKTYLPYDQWVRSQCDYDGDGKVGAKSSSLRTRNKENKSYKEKLANPNTYTQWESYVQTIVAANDEESRRLKAQWETSRYYEIAQQDTGRDAYNDNATGTAITTQYDKDIDYMQQDNTQRRTTTIIIAVAAMVLIYFILNKK